MIEHRDEESSGHVGQLGVVGDVDDATRDGEERREMRTIISATISTSRSSEMLPANCSRRSWAATNFCTTDSSSPASPIIDSMSMLDSESAMPLIRGGLLAMARRDPTNPTTTRSATVCAAGMSTRNCSK